MLKSVWLGEVGASITKGFDGLAIFGLARCAVSCLVSTLFGSSPLLVNRKEKNAHKEECQKFRFHNARSDA